MSILITPQTRILVQGITGGFGGLSLNAVTTPVGIPLDSQRWLYYVTWAVAASICADVKFNSA